ncbi:MAG: hypothetical protein KDE27_00925, partial [Planctomycetes bacterium]|nr:hypothetical protein [Planctomycetota bacterium]
SLAALTLPHRASLRGGEGSDAWASYAHHQLCAFESDGLHLGHAPDEPVNGYRSGEKVVLQRSVPDDLVAEVTITFPAGADSRSAGMLLRTSGPAVGYDAHRGYFAGILPGRGAVVFGRMDGEHWTELARTDVALDAGTPHRLRVAATGPQFAVAVDDRALLRVEDGTWPRGQLGLRVVDTHAVFTDLELRDR